MKVIPITEDSKAKLDAFLATIEGVRPAVFIGIDAENSPVIWVEKLEWKELAHIKMAFDMHVTRDWLGLL